MAKCNSRAGASVVGRDSVEP